MKFKSAVDGWYYLLAIGAPIAVLISFLATVNTMTTSDIAVIVSIMLLTLALPFWLLLATEYVVGDKDLKIRSGPFKWTVPLAEIKSVTPSRSLLSSPALSLNRLKIEYGEGRTILVSPEDIEGFKQALGRVAPI